AVVILLGAAVSLVPGLAQRSEYGAERFRDRGAYAGHVLHGAPVPTSARLPYAVAHSTLESVLYGVGATALALALAALGLYRRRRLGGNGGRGAEARADHPATRPGRQGLHPLPLPAGDRPAPADARPVRHEELPEREAARGPHPGALCEAPQPVAALQRSRQV